MHRLLSLVGNQTEQLVSLIVENAPIGIYTINKAGIIDFVNPKFAEISGDTEVQLIGLNALALQSYEEFGLLPYFLAGLKGEPFETEVRYVAYYSKKESYRHYVGVPMKTLSGEVERLLLLVEDVTERKLLELELKKALELKGEEIAELTNKIHEQG